MGKLSLSTRVEKLSLSTGSDLRKTNNGEFFAHGEEGRGKLTQTITLTILETNAKNIAGNSRFSIP